MERAKDILELLEKMPDAVADRFLAELQGASMALDAMDETKAEAGA